MKACRRHRSTHLNLSTRGGQWSVRALPLYSQGKSGQYPFDRRLGGPKSQSGCFGENVLAPAGIQIADHAHSSSHYTNKAIAVPDFLDSP